MSQRNEKLRDGQGFTKTVDIHILDSNPCTVPHRVGHYPLAEILP